MSHSERVDLLCYRIGSPKSRSLSFLHISRPVSGNSLHLRREETDDWAPPEMVEGLKAHLAASAVRHEVEWYPGTHHGFAFPGRGSIYDKEAAERHWSRLFALFARNL